MERLIWKHRDMVDDMRKYLHELASGDPKEGEEWLGNTPSELERLTNQCERDIINPTKELADLMYKSVGIRDARLSLQLGLSMWRLSWITFIFLPLTFMCGFFGMNVDTFEENPSIKCTHSQHSAKTRCAEESMRLCTKTWRRVIHTCGREEGPDLILSWREHWGWSSGI